MRVPKTLHMILFALYPFVFIFSVNLDDFIMLDELLWPVTITLVACATIYFVLRAILKNNERACIMVTFLTVCFFSYGHAYGALKWTGIGHEHLLAAYVIILATGTYLIASTKRNLEGVIKLLNVVSVFLFAICIVNILAHEANNQPNVIGKALEDDFQPIVLPTRPPDIYYIILDGYASEKTLNEFYGYDNSEFLNYLMERNFYIPSKSRSNYAQTPLSLISSLNMMHLTQLTNNNNINTKKKTQFYKMFIDKRVPLLLKDVGYRYVYFNSGSVGYLKRDKNADWNIDCNGDDEFTTIMMQTTMLNALESDFFGEDMKKMGGSCQTKIAHRLCVFSTLPKVQHKIGGPRFVYSHIIMPHPPYLFGPDGEERCDEMTLNTWNNKKAYLNQLTFTNKKIKEVVDRILSESPTPPIIIIQSDHGPYTSMIESKSMQIDRMRNFEAFYFPDNGSKSLYDSVSPVNIFRIIFNRYFNASFALLKDESVYSSSARPYQFKRITSQLYKKSDDTK
jgi:hypothetical protein